MMCDNCKKEFTKGGRVTEEYVFCPQCVDEVEKEFRRLTGLMPEVWKKKDNKKEEYY
jgi:predicted amidophosphoribosyltransferase